MNNRIKFILALIGLFIVSGCSQTPDKLDTQAPPPGPDARPDPVSNNKQIPGAPGSPQGGTSAPMGGPGIIR